MDVDIVEIIVHDRYDPDNGLQCHNLALVRLNQSIAYSANIRPLCLPLALRTRKSTYDNAYLYVAFIAALVDDTYAENDFRGLLMNPSGLNVICVGSAGKLHFSNLFHGFCTKIRSFIFRFIGDPARPLMTVHLENRMNNQALQSTTKPLCEADESFPFVAFVVNFFYIRNFSVAAFTDLFLYLVES